MTSTMNDVDSFLFASGAKSAKLANVGDKVSGIVTDAAIAPQTDLDGNVKTFGDGKRMMQLVVTLQIAERDDDDDDGLRRLYASGGRFTAESGTGTSMRDAIAEAIRKSGANSLEVGARLTVAHSGLGKQEKRGYSQPKLYVAKYEPAVTAVSIDDL